MASGRLGRCIIGNRSGAEVYHNASGKEVAVTLFAQSISTNLNTELTTTVGVAATILGNTVIISNSGSTGTYQSTTSFNFSCAFCRCDDAGSNYPPPSIGSTFQGAYRTWRCCCPLGGTLGPGGNYPTRIPAFISTDGNITDPANTGCLCLCDNCCTPIWFGGNEIHTPAIWMDAQEPRICFDTTHGPMYQSNVVGWYPQSYCGNGMCCKGQRCYMPTGYASLITQRQLGTGVTATQRAAQFMNNPICKCGEQDTWFMPNGGTNNTFPLQNFQGCGASNGCCCMGGSHCNIQGCKHVFEGSWNEQTTLNLFNYYALCNSPCNSGKPFICGVRCCVTTSTCNHWTTAYTCGAGALGWPSVANMGPYTIACGKYQSPMFWNISWCGNCNCCTYGHIVQGNGYHVRAHCNQGCCGCIQWSEDLHKCLRNEGCYTNAAGIFYAICRWMCQFRSCCFPINCPTNTKRMSPYGFMYGMTNCMVMMYRNSNQNGQCYRFGFNDICLWNRCWCQWGPCMFTQIFEIRIPMTDMATQTDEFAIKYMAFNPFDNYVYAASRSSESLDCGIFRFDPNEFRRQAGIFCGCSNASCHCCGGICETRSHNIGSSEWATVLASDGGVGAEGLKKMANWPTEWANIKYTSPGFCVSCLYRAEKCLWTIGVFDNVSKKWDGYTSNNLWQWSKSADPLVQKVSETLTRSVTDDYRCVVEVCNCFFSNMDCSGLIDYKVSANQYERTGIVLSNGDRIMVNNNGDIKTAVQVWGYEG